MLLLLLSATGCMGKAGREENANREKVKQEIINGETQDKVETRKRNILKELYIKGQKQSEFIYNNYEVERTFYLDKDKLIKDLAPYFFRN